MKNSRHVYISIGVILHKCYKKNYKSNFSGTGRTEVYNNDIQKLKNENMHSY